MAIFNRRLHSLEDTINNAEHYDEYKEACLEHDELSGAEEWKHKDPCRDYDYRLIRKRVQRMKLAQSRDDIFGLMSILHEGLHGNLGNIANPAMKSRCKIGTKKLIESFIENVVLALDSIYQANETEVDFYEKLNFFEETSHAFGRSCLMLSGGAGLGFFHAGVVQSLHEHRVLPSVISGASAGSIIGGLLATKKDQALQACLEPEFIYETFKQWRIWRGFSRKGLFDARGLENALIQLFDLSTFEEAYQQTGRHVTVTVSPSDLHQNSRLLNAKTSPNAIIAQAVRASCAVPVILSPVQLRAKAPNGDIIPYIPSRRFADGSLMADLPFERLARLYGVNHSIVSQTNPLAVPFLSSDKKNSKSILNMTVRHLGDLAKRNSVYMFDVLEELVPDKASKLAIHKCRSIIDQQYVGDINILPEKNIGNLARILSNPSLNSIANLVNQGRKATWGQLDAIRRNTQISETLRAYLKQLKEREARMLRHCRPRDIIDKRA
jgi:predicted acylesterase/phospholipase RssA